MTDRYCEAPDCENPARRRYCDLHEKRAQRGQSLTAPKQERLSPQERLYEAAIRYADAEEDEEFEVSRRALWAAARAANARDPGGAIREAMASARARGILPGPALKLEPAEARRVLDLVGGNVSLAAKLLKASRQAVYRALRSVAGSGISQQLPEGESVARSNIADNRTCPQDEGA